MPRLMRTLAAIAVLAMPPAWLHAQPAPPLSLAQIMADPDWIGPGVEDAWWRWDGNGVQYRLKRTGSPIRDVWQLGLDGAPAAIVDTGAQADLDGADPVYDGERRRMAFVRNGDVFVRDLRHGALTQLTRGNDTASHLQWGSDGSLIWRIDAANWYRWTPRLGVGQAARIEAENGPEHATEPDDLRARQLRLIQTLRQTRAERNALQQQDASSRRSDPTRAPAPVYLGDTIEIVDSALAPDGRWLLVATTDKDADSGRSGKMPRYVTESGYEEFEDVRTRVGRNPPGPHRLWLADMHDSSVRELRLDPLPGVARDPLAALRKAAGKPPLQGRRDLRLADDRNIGDGAAIQWSADSRRVALMLRAVDNKDRWLASVDPADSRLRPLHRLTDPAWINWDYNAFGWLPDNRGLWLLSEQSGHSHLYTVAADGKGKPRALTSGRWEVSQPRLAADGRRFLFLCNRNWPGSRQLCAVPLTGGAVRELTALPAIERFTPSPDGRRLLLHHSASYLPTQLALVDADGNGLRTLTDTRTSAYKAVDWLQPEYVQVPSRHGAGVIWGKYYGPRRLQPGRKYPIVMFVHGAGYLQNVHAGYPNYFREQMFHNLLVQQGYIVLDLDYRASQGYGRDWRTAIYRQMGQPELEDYLDGLEWLVAHKQGDRARAGIYGGSYGGFLTFMALFKRPGVFKAGAALRPVADWSQYNHPYTSNILNTPELDPDAYRRSSPIELADRLQDHLLIAHGMIDDNVFFKDSVMMAQRLIELRKEHWEVAAYPLERHGFIRPDAWYDQYRRIHALFERTLKPAAPPAETAD